MTIPSSLLTTARPESDVVLAWRTYWRIARVDARGAVLANDLADFGCAGPPSVDPRHIALRNEVAATIERGPFSLIEQPEADPASLSAAYIERIVEALHRADEIIAIVDQARAS